MTLVLGISAHYHDAAAAIVRDGAIVAAAQEERFTRVKHDPRFPVNALNYCLEEAFVDPSELDAVAFYDNPVRSWDRVLRSAAQAGEAARETFAVAARSMLGHKVWVESQVRSAVGEGPPVLFCEHHLSHAASAFFPSPFERAAILTVDGVGEWATTTIGAGAGGHLELLEEITYPHSLGLLYSAFTAFCGFKVNSGEYKLMGLAPYGEPVFEDVIRRELIDLRADGSYRLNLDYFDYLAGGQMVNERFEALFGGPGRLAESEITRRECDLASSIQAVTTDAVERLARHACEVASSRNLVMAGGVALNCVANGALLRRDFLDGVWVQPAAGDAGGSLGAALTASHLSLGAPRRVVPGDAQQGSYLGPAFSPAEVRSFLDRHGYPYQHVPDDAARAEVIAAVLDGGGIVGLLSGRMEFGPRSLGARSILGDPRRADTQTTMNLKIKYRESFRPFAPAVLAERAGEYFELDTESPYMLLVAPVRQERRTDQAITPRPGGEAIDLLELVRAPRSDIPAVTHVDHSARIQTVDGRTPPELGRVLEAFDARTGCAVLVNTSFNVRGEPIVCTPADAYRCFMRTGIDVLVLEDCILRKADQPALVDDDDWRERYGND